MVNFPRSLWNFKTIFENRRYTSRWSHMIFFQIFLPITILILSWYITHDVFWYSRNAHIYPPSEWWMQEELNSSVLVSWLQLTLWGDDLLCALIMSCSFEMNSIHLKTAWELFEEEIRIMNRKTWEFSYFLQKSRNIQHRISISKEIFSLFISKKKSTDAFIPKEKRTFSGNAFLKKHEQLKNSNPKIYEKWAKFWRQPQNFWEETCNANFWANIVTILDLQKNVKANFDSDFQN